MLLQVGGDETLLDDSTRLDELLKGGESAGGARGVG